MGEVKGVTFVRLIGGASRVSVVIWGRGMGMWMAA